MKAHQLTEKEVFVQRLEVAKDIIKDYLLKREINPPLEIAEILSTIEKGDALLLSKEALYCAYAALANTSKRGVEISYLRDMFFCFYEYKKLTN